MPHPVYAKFNIMSEDMCTYTAAYNACCILHRGLYVSEYRQSVVLYRIAVQDCIIVHLILVSSS